MRPIIRLTALVALALPGCHHFHWPHDHLLPPADAATACPPTEVCVDPCDPCAPPYYSGEYVLIEPDAAYVVPGPAVPSSPGAFAPPPPPPAPQAELPGWFDVLPPGSGAISPDFGLPRAPLVEDRLPNPLTVRVVNNELAWDQLADVVSTYFPLGREQPVQLIDGVLTEGFIETPPIPGATIFEPQRKDSAGRFNRWESTLQSIRRRAYIRVVPTAEGWAIEPQVVKELEDLPYPEHASAGMAALRSDNSLPTDRVGGVSLTRDSEYWIPLGRDEPLEQKMLREIYERLTTGR